MNCPLCQAELVFTPDDAYPDKNNARCPAVETQLGYSNSHYSKYVHADWGFYGIIEEMIIYPYKIINHDMIYSGKAKSVYVSIKKYNPNRMTSGAIKEIRPGFERIMQFHGYLHPDTEDNLRDRLKLLLLLS